MNKRRWPIGVQWRHVLPARKGALLQIAWPGGGRLQTKTRRRAFAVWLAFRIHVTTSQAAALLYAAGVNRGVIYECEPVGDIEPDPDCSMPGLSWQCEKARVIRCIKPKARDIETARAVLLHEA